MTHRVLHVDYRIQEPNRRRILSESLPEGYELVIPESFDTESILRAAKDARVIFTSFEPLTGEMMRAASDLRAVGKAGSGVDSIDVAAATALKIPVMNSPGHLRSDAIAEHAITLMVS